MSQLNLESGTILEARADTTVAGIVHWEAPLSTGFDAIVPAGTRLRVIEPPLPEATAIGCLPVSPNVETVVVPLRDRRDEKYAGFHIVVPLAEVGERWRVLDPIGPERTLLESVRVLHGRGAANLQVMPYHYATGHWRCPIFVGGARTEALGYSNAMDWQLPGRSDTSVIDPERAADAIWAALDGETRRAAQQPDPAYAFWFSAMLDRCHDRMLPSLWSDYSNHRAEGFVRLAGRVDASRGYANFPLPPGEGFTLLGS